MRAANEKQVLLISFMCSGLIYSERLLHGADNLLHLMQIVKQLEGHIGRSVDTLQGFLV